MELFANAKVIVGYHGARLANAAFSPPFTVVLEYTTFYDMDAHRLWRTNEKVAKVHGVSIDMDKINLEFSANVTDADHLSKALKP